MAYTANAFISNMSSRLGKGGAHVWNFYKLPRGTAWCAGEISYTFRQIGAKSKWYGGNPVFYVPYAQEWMAKHWKTVYSGPKDIGYIELAEKGDIIIFSWTKWSRDHIGAIYTADKSGKTVRTIEGNTSGSKVDTRTREKRYIHSIYRPDWSTGKTSKYAGQLPKLPARGWFQRGDRGQDVVKLQAFLNWAVDYNLDLDGILGAKTSRAILAYQGEYGLAMDGGFGKDCLSKAKEIRK